MFYDAPIYEGDKPKVVNISRICKDYIIDETNGNCVLGDLKYYKPILLTKEWLLKFRFNDKDTVHGWLAFGTDNLYLVGDESEMYFGYNNNELELPKIKYVHQLQNLYFALTGEELKIK